MKERSKIKISSTYAKAWYDGAVQEKELGKAFDDSKSLALVFGSEDIIRLSNPILPLELKNQIIREIAKKMKLCSSTHGLLNVLAENKRLKYSPSIIKDFQSLYYNANGITEVFVQTVKPLNENQNEKLHKNLEKFLDKKVVVSYEIKPDIIGGLKIAYGTYEIDDSIKGKLDYLESVMKGSE